MDIRRLPPLNSLRAFAALAEAGSFSAAGAKLNVTHAAVIQQVRALEKDLETSLALREGRKVKLTPAGEKLASELNGAFDTMVKAVAEIRGSDNRQPVQVTTTPAFAVSWLMPRLVDFQQLFPEITLLINPTSEIVELKPGGVDLAIRYRPRDKVDDNFDAVLVADMVVVGTPELLKGADIKEIGDLIDMPWLQELGTNEVAQWFQDHDVVMDRPPMIYHMPGNLIMQAVRRGDGITYTARPFVDEDIRAGRLVELASDDRHGFYCLETRPGVRPPQVTNFIEWMRAEAAKSGQN